MEKAGVIERKSSIEHIIKDHTCCQWKTRKKRIHQVIKSNDEYFPKGWKYDTMENGMLSFLEWFKRKAKGATDVFLQDPYFEDVALFFLASADTESEYTVLTQTHLKTNSDGSDAIVPENDMPERKKTIQLCILQNPTLFNRMKLIVKDIPVSDNKLHDRYILFTYPNGKSEAYTLSNSIQGATTKQPLLVTQIGDNAYNKLRIHLTELLDKNSIETIYDYREQKELPSEDVSEIADPGFYNWLCNRIGKESEIDTRLILEDIFGWNTIPKISTFGYGLACIPDSENYNIIQNAAIIIKNNNEWIAILKDFILAKHYSQYPVGFIGCPHFGYGYRNPSYLVELSFNEIVSRYNIYILEYAGIDTDTFRVWGQYYACQILSKTSPEEAIDVLKQLRRTLVTIRYDKQITPVFKATTVLLNALLLQASYCDDYKIMDILLKDDEEWCRALGALLLVYYSRNSEFDAAGALNKISNKNELIHVCKLAWGLQDRIADMNLFYSRLIDVYENKSSDDILKELVTLLQDPYIIEYKIDFVEKVIKPLIEHGFLSCKTISDYVIEGIYAKSISADNAVQLRRILPGVLYSLNGSFDMLVIKAKNTIKKFLANVRSIVIPDDDSLFEAAREVINLRNLLRDLLYLCDLNENPKGSTVKHLLTEVDAELDKVGLHNTKLKFE